jgi:hypothetical protein
VQARTFKDVWIEWNNFLLVQKYAVHDTCYVINDLIGSWNWVNGRIYTWYVWWYLRKRMCSKFCDGVGIWPNFDSFVLIFHDCYLWGRGYQWIWMLKFELSWIRLMLAFFNNNLPKIRNNNSLKRQTISRWNNSSLGTI